MSATANRKLVKAIKQRMDWDESLDAAFEMAAAAPAVNSLLSDPGLRDKLDFKQIEKDFGENVARLTREVNQLGSIKEAGAASIDSPQQAEKLRRLLMAIISDVRVMLIRLCYRVERLRLVKHGDYDQRHWIARETLDIYAPLANRLGMGLLKWELEDLAFRPATDRRREQPE